MRVVREAPQMLPPEGAYDEFVARFPFEETEDQIGSIEAVLEDLASGRPMDRLVCGDVGFGKTEVALRAAFVAALAGFQVAVVVPTTLLARQHYRSFVERFRGFPIRVAQASRLVAPKELDQVKKDLKEGQIDIVVGTHALLGKSVEFAHLGLVIIDEEQHFGVAHKERLKKMRARCACADAVGHADPAHIAIGAVRRARAFVDHDAAGRPAGGAFLHLAVRSGHSARGAAA